MESAPNRVGLGKLDRIWIKLHSLGETDMHHRVVFCLRLVVPTKNICDYISVTSCSTLYWVLYKLEYTSILTVKEAR